MATKTSGKRQATNVAPKKLIKPVHLNKKIYHIVWRDAFSESDEWHDEDSISCEEYICETIGFLIENNKKPEYITIASTITLDGAFCSIMNIPKTMIIKKTLLKPKMV